MKTLLFVDDEPRVLQGLQRQLHPMRSEWSMHFMDGAARALEFMASHPVDIVVSDMIMPGMDGAQLLTEVAKRHPQTVRIILSGHAEREAVLRLVGPAHQYLSKPCDADELRKAIVRAFALRDLLGNEHLKQLTTRIKNLPTLPSLQKQLTEELRKESPSLENIGQLISRDVGMTAKILQLVNSAFFGLAQPIGSPTEATAYLGLNTIRALVLSMGIFYNTSKTFVPASPWTSLAGILGWPAPWPGAWPKINTATKSSSNSAFLPGCFMMSANWYWRSACLRTTPWSSCEPRPRTCRSGRWKPKSSAPPMRMSAPICSPSGDYPTPLSKLWPIITNPGKAPSRDSRPPWPFMSRMYLPTPWSPLPPRCPLRNSIPSISLA